MLRRLPIESAETLVLFAVARVAITLASLITVALLGFPFAGHAAAVLGGLMLPWSLGCLIVTRRDPERALSPLVMVGDLVVLLVFELVVPEAIGAVRSTALFLIAAHAHFQGERRGLAFALTCSIVLVIGSAIRGGTLLGSHVRTYFDVVFVLASASIGFVVGTLRTAESASRLRARAVSRRTIQAENQVRRRVADAIHDGPVQELIGLDMILSSARKAAVDGRREDADALLQEARELTSRNIEALRDEIVDLGPYAFEELGFETAIENCLPTWKRRYGFEVMASIERIDMSSDLAGDLFRIAQEAVINAGRHADADAVSISLRTIDSQVELRVTDDGHGFDGADPLGLVEPGHLGLASMRERAELLDGELEITTSELGTRVLVRAPL
jgi:two-component system, NarL family, sensor kinase